MQEPHRHMLTTPDTIQTAFSAQVSIRYPHLVRSVASTPCQFRIPSRPHICLFRVRRRYLEENVGALAVKLTADELKELEAAMPADKVTASSTQSNALQLNGCFVKMKDVSLCCTL
jgi:hypothetical protein